MTDAETCRHLRKRLLVASALLVYLALLAIWQIATIQTAALEPMGVFTLGLILGAMTGVGIVLRHRWYLYLASRP